MTIQLEHVLFDCEIRFGRTAKPKHFSELLFLEQHIPVCVPDLIERAQTLELESNNLLHILHDGEKLPVWKDWLRGCCVWRVRSMQAAGWLSAHWIRRLVHLRQALDLR